MRISTRGRYGLRAMVELALHFGEGPIPLKNIANQQELSEHYLEQLMGNLRKAGLVKSVRGAQGGYELAKAPPQISAGDILRVLEGPISPVECIDEGKKKGSCEKIDLCPTRILWLRIYEQINKVLDSTTLEDLRAEAQRLATSPQYI
jgi:Rrf2 family cysteine metabolism transcriptional repressor